MVVMFTMTWTRIICFYACAMTYSHIASMLVEKSTTTTKTVSHSASLLQPITVSEHLAVTPQSLHRRLTQSFTMTAPPVRKPLAGPRKTGSSVQELAAAPRAPQRFPYGHHTLRKVSQDCPLPQMHNRITRPTDVDTFLFMKCVPCVSCGAQS